MRLATILVSLLLTAALLAGCGRSSGTDSTSSGGGGEGPAGVSTQKCAGGVGATGVSCGAAEAIAAGWKAAPGCAISGGASHASCRIKGYLCIAAAVEKGTEVSCALPERSVFFEVRG